MYTQRRTPISALSELPDEVLHCEVKRLAGRANTLLAELLAHLAEVEARGVHREFAPAPAAPARIEPLHDGSEEGAVDALAPARTRNTWANYVRALAGPVRELRAGTATGEAPPAALPESSADLSGRPRLVTGDDRPIPSPSPLNVGAQYRIQFTADQAYVDLLEEARDLLQHSVPDRNFIEVQRRALQALVEKLRARTRAAGERPRPSKPQTPPHSELTRKAAQQKASKKEITAPARRHVPAAVRRVVWQRDAALCTYTDTRGQRCRERAGLQLHHRAPHARGGPATVDNLTLRCRAHNALAAEQDSGRQWMRERKRSRAGAER